MDAPFLCHNTRDIMGKGKEVLSPVLLANSKTLKKTVQKTGNVPSVVERI